MAVTNNLLIYAASTNNKMDDTTYSNNSQRQNGVQASQIVSSSLHNTVMRSTTLLLKVLVDSLISNSEVGSGEISTNSSEQSVKSVFDSLLSGLHVTRSSEDGDGANIAKTYAVDLQKVVNSTSKIVILQLLAKTATGSSRLIGSQITIDEVAKAYKITTNTCTVNEDCPILLKQGSSWFTPGVASITFNPSTGELKTKQVSSPTQFGNDSLCLTAASISTKVVNLSNFVLKDGAHIFVRFNNTNTAMTVNLNVNSTGAKSVMNGADGLYHTFVRNKVYEFMYADDAWQVLNPDEVENAKQINGVPHLYEHFVSVDMTMSGTDTWEANATFSVINTSSAPFSTMQEICVAVVNTLRVCSGAVWKHPNSSAIAVFGYSTQGGGFVFIDSDTNNLIPYTDPTSTSLSYNISDEVKTLF